MTPSIWMAATGTISLLLSIAAMFYSWHSARQRATQQELATLRSKVDEVESNRARSVGELRDRVNTLEGAIEHLPSLTATHELAMRIEEMHGDMKGLSQALKGVQGQLETVNMHLLNDGRRT